MNDLSHLFINETPLLDVRAPIEFKDGHFPGSVNRPLLNDEERKQVGTLYRERGQEAAIKLGHELVNGSVKEARVLTWIKFIDENPQAKLYCFRGGLRSKISQEWIHAAGKSIEMIPGGYKAIRRFLITELESRSLDQSFLLLAGKTGCGKTEFLSRQPLPSLDLEKEACHRGSSFGYDGIQPSQVTFENRLAVGLIKTGLAKEVLIEDESIMIGKCVIPLVLFQAMKISKLIVLERGIEDRTDHIIQEYVLNRISGGTCDPKPVYEELREGLVRISKKLGGLKFHEIDQDLKSAFSSNEVIQLSAHRPWVLSLLKDYYDPHYERSLTKRKDKILFQGEASGILEFLRNRIAT